MEFISKEYVWRYIKFIIINIYSGNVESQQLLTMTELHKLSQKIFDIGNKNIIIRKDFNFHFNSKLKEEAGKPTLKKSFGKMIEII